MACAELKRTGCHARAILPVNGAFEDLRVTKVHNHPPDENAEEKEFFFAHLRDASKSMSGSLKNVYENVALL